MDIIILRHGEAGKRVPVASRDVERTLTVQGREEVGAVAESIRSLKLDIDLIATSPLKRASETAEIVARKLKKEKLLQLWDELKPEGDTDALYRRLSKLKADSTVVLVGHEPYLSSMIGEVTAGKASSVRIVLKKAGLARMELTEFVPRPSGTLRWLLPPRLIKRMA